MPFIKAPSGIQIHYQIPSSPDRSRPTLDPNKPVVLLLHPRFFDLHFFAPQYNDPRLAKGYNLLAVDHHYHGETKCNIDNKPYDFWMIAKDILHVLETLKVKQAHVFGNSLGGPIAVRMYMLKAEKIASLILCAKHPPVETEENIEQYRFLRDACYERADDGSDNLPSDVIHALMYIYFGEDPTAQALVDEWVATGTFRPSNRKLITKIFSSLLDREPVERRLWNKISCPVLIIHGENDVPYPPQVAHDHYAAMPNADRELHIIPDAPHFLSWTHPVVVNEITANFLDRITGVDSRRAAMMPARSSTTPTQRDFLPLASIDRSLSDDGLDRMVHKKKSFLARVGLKSN